MNEKTVKIGEKEVKLRTSAYTPILYSELFGENVFAEMGEIITVAGQTGSIPVEKTFILYKVAYCMAKHADPDLPEMKDWLEQFDVYDIPEIVGDMIELWTAENKTQSDP